MKDNNQCNFATDIVPSVSPQANYHVCSAGWLENGRVAYPTAYASKNCGSGVVGIVDYGTRNNKSEMWDVYCFRMKGNCQQHIPSLPVFQMNSSQSGQSPNGGRGRDQA